MSQSFFSQSQKDNLGLMMEQQPEEFLCILSQEKGHLCRVLHWGITAWCKERKSRNLRLLARITKVPYATLKRIEYGQNNPSAETALPIIWAVFPMEKRLILFKVFFPRIFSCLHQIG